MDDVAVALEHVDLLDGLDGLGVQLLQGGLELLVVVGVPGDIALLLVSRGTLSTCNLRSFGSAESPLGIWLCCSIVRYRIES